MTLSSRWAPIIAAALGSPAWTVPVAAQAQDAAAAVYGPSENEADAPVSCEDLPAERDTIVVCRETIDPETVMSVIKQPVDPAAGDIPRAPLLAEPPCWVTKDKPVCVRFGKVPEYPPLVDLTAFPEPLSEADAALVSAAADEDGDQAILAPRVAAGAPVTGARVPIPLED